MFVHLFVIIVCIKKNSCTRACSYCMSEFLSNSLSTLLGYFVYVGPLSIFNSLSMSFSTSLLYVKTTGLKLVNRVNVDFGG